MADPTLTEREALAALNQLRSNLVATQSAGWSNLVYPLVAILDAAGFEQGEPTEAQEAEHFDCYGGAGGFPGRLKDLPGAATIYRARNARREREQLRRAMHGAD